MKEFVKAVKTAKQGLKIFPNSKKLKRAWQSAYYQHKFSKNKKSSKKAKKN